jgi:tetratricopeptide (TPR) repeat protein
MLLVCSIPFSFPPLLAADEWRDAVTRSMSLEQEGKYHEARAVLNRALEEARLDPGDPVRAGTVLWRLGWVCFSLGDYDEASLRYRASIIQLEKALGSAHPVLATVMGGYASVLEARLEFKAAERIRRRALEILESTVGREHPDAFAIRADLARGFYAKGDYPRAEAALRQVLADWPANRPEMDARLAQLWSCLGYVLQKTSRPAEAMEAFRRSLGLTSKLAGPGHPVHLDARYGLALALIACGLAGQAAQILEESSAQADRILGPAHPLSLQILETRGRVLRQLGAKAQARQMEKEVAIRGKSAARIPPSVSFADLAGGK